MGGAHVVLRRTIESVGVGVVFFAAAMLGLRVGLPGTSASPVWIGAGVSLAGALLFGRHVLIGVFVAAVLAEWTANALPLSVALAVANVVEPLIAATALRRYCGLRCDLLHTRDTVVLLVFGAGLAAATSATIGACSLGVALDLDAAAVRLNWFTWWLGDVSGLILIAPLIVYFVRQPHRWPAWPRALEGAVLVSATAAVGLTALTGTLERVWALPAQFLIMVLIIWTAFSLGPSVSMLSVNIVAAVSVLSAVRMRGPFIGSSLNTTLLSLQAAMCALAVAVLMLATLVEQRRQALLAADATLEELEVRVRERTAQLEELATHDGLTGLMNRRAFDALLVRAIHQARRGHISALLYGDLDGFKGFNDAHGHLAGDRALVAVADILRDEARDADVVARLGGDEFAVLLDGAHVDGAATVSSRIDARVARLGGEFGSGLGMSIGLVAIDGRQDADGVLAAADGAMYEKKPGSRDPGRPA